MLHKPPFSEIVSAPKTEGEIACWCEVSADRDFVYVVTDEFEGQAVLTHPAAKLVREALGRAIEWADDLRGEKLAPADGDYICVRRETFRALEAERDQLRLDLAVANATVGHLKDELDDLIERIEALAGEEFDHEQGHR